MRNSIDWDAVETAIANIEVDKLEGCPRYEDARTIQ